ncbi:autotransporter outer membrane beta-barrel domain-containing protein [Thalassospira sp.]|uniref:autotransporter outer membrane beta-barrel domain-containing protein n=1 Tax=Thalassospira sp. TaxID=1912094 RepID=UPI0027364644|nr:autotransporter outer membrane beta-barrel domain-containing protein [Thalassospira sp.]MDP2698743.1 autotransporter outer membrane beta-barrel domain-containing protein [Thalassospira sp.]
MIQQNIGARVSAVTGAVGGSATGTVGTNTGGAVGTGGTSGTGGTEPANFTDSLTYDNSNTDREDALRRFAMMGSFDSSTGLGLAALGLGPTDQGSDSGVGGASGVDGRSALESASPFTVWGHGSFTRVDNDYVSGTTDNRYDGDVWGYNVGLDYSFADTLTAGVSMGYNDTDLTTSFNSGTYKETGWVLSPYAIYRPIADLTVVAEAGFGQGDVDVTRNSGAITGNADSGIWYAALSTSYKIRPVETLPVSLSPSVALITARKTVDGYTESDGTRVESTRSNTRQIKPGIEAAYDFTPTDTLMVTPFVETGLVYDFTDEINNDKTAFNIGGGVRLSDALTGLNAALEGSYLVGRSDYNEYTIGGTITYGFAISDDEGRQLGVVKPFFGSNLNEYGNQRIRTGLGFTSGGLTGELSLNHMMSIANEEDTSDSSSIQLGVSMPF